MTNGIPREPLVDSRQISNSKDVSYNRQSRVKLEQSADDCVRPTDVDLCDDEAH